LTAQRCTDLEIFERESERLSEATGTLISYRAENDLRLLYE